MKRGNDQRFRRSKAAATIPKEPMRNLYITVLMERIAQSNEIMRHPLDLDTTRKMLEQKTDAELCLMVQVGRELQSK